MLDRSFSERLYQRLLGVYPRAHREEYGPAMAQLFRDQHREALRTGTHRVILLWLLIVGDLLKSSLSEHLTAMKGKTSMLESLLKRRGPSFPRFTFLVTFATASLVVFGAIAFVTFALPKSYSGVTKVLLTYVSQPAGGVAVAADPNLIQREVEAIQSDAVLSRVVDRLNLEALWGKQFTPGSTMVRADAIQLLRRSLNVRPARNSSVITIEAYSGEPEQAAVIANQTASAYCQSKVESDPRAVSLGGPAPSRIMIIQSAVPDHLAVRPNKALSLFIGLILATIVGLAVGGAALWLAVRNASKNYPPLPDAASTQTRTLGAKLAGIVWILASAALAATVLIASLMDGWSFAQFRDLLLTVTFIAFWGLNVWAGILLFQGKFLARICVGIEALMLAVCFGLVPMPQAFRWAFVLFAVAVAVGCFWRGRQIAVRTGLSC